MQHISDSIARMFSLSPEEIVKLHFAIQEEVKAQYKLRANTDNLNNAIALCEKSVAISGLVMEAMKKKHKAECNEYARLIGSISPNSKFYCPSHYAANQLAIIFRKQGKHEQSKKVEEKVALEGWGSGKYIDLLDL